LEKNKYSKIKKRKEDKKRKSSKKKDKNLEGPIPQENGRKSD